jgi:diketogulonate reductase-like aldo/keto reductase
MMNYPLPPWAADIDCANWAQFLLKFVISHPAVTCVIPATRRVDHVEENMGADARPDAGCQNARAHGAPRRECVV